MGGSARKGPPSEVVSPPAHATFFRLQRVVGKGEKGKKAKCYGDPLPDGTVPDRWDVSEFSPAGILATFGADKYRVDWYQADGTRINGRIFSVAAPVQPGSARIAPRRARRHRDADELEDDEPRARREPEGITFRELMAMQAEDRREAQRREERADELRRQESAAAQQRDREFMAMVLGTISQQRSTPIESNDLLRRELSLELRQGLAALRADIAGIEPEEPETDEPPSLEGVGHAVLGELEARAPHLVGELLPEVARWLQARGFVPSPQVAQAIAGAGAPQNGRGNAGQS